MNEKFTVTNAKTNEEAASDKMASDAIAQAVAARAEELDKALELQLEKVEIKDGDVFVVKMSGEEFDDLTLQAFKRSLRGKFPKVEFIVLNIPKDHSIEFQKLAAK